MRLARSTHRKVLKGEEAKLARYKKWVRLSQKETNAKIQDRLWLLGHTFDEQPKGN